MQGANRSPERDQSPPELILKVGDNLYSTKEGAQPGRRPLLSPPVPPPGHCCHPHPIMLPVSISIFLLTPRTPPTQALPSTQHIW